MDIADINVIKALPNTKKGRLRYDRFWAQEGRTKDIIDEISNQLTSLTISSKALTIIQKHDHPYCISQNNGEYESRKIETSTLSSNLKSHDAEAIFLQRSNTKEVPLLEYEEERVKAAKAPYDLKKQEFESFNNKLLLDVEKEYEKFKQRLCVEELQKATVLKQYEEILKKAKEEEVQEKKQILGEVAAKVPDEQNVLKNVPDQNELKSKLEELLQTLFASIAYIKELLKTYCENKPYETTCSSWMNHLSINVTSLNEIVQAAKRFPITQETMVKAQSIFDESNILIRNITIELETYKEQKEKLEIFTQSVEINTMKNTPPYVPPKLEEKRTHIEQKEKLEIFTQSVEINTMKNTPPYVPAKLEEKRGELNVNSTPEETKISSKEEELEITTDVGDMEECDPVEKKEPSPQVDFSAFQEYFSVMENLKKVESSFEGFKNNHAHKKYRLLLHKAVAINTISDASGAQLKSKIHHIVNLFSGQTVESGGKYVSCNHDPLALVYCKNLLAEKIVTQGEEQVRSKVAAAFPFAALAVALCSKFPELWQLILGHFFLRCPYLVPYYPPRAKNQSDEDYFLSLGYKYADGKVEETTNFLKRMSGFASLYAAIVQTETLAGFPLKQSHKVEHGWKWIAQVLNSDPRPDVTATLLLAILEVLGHLLSKNYDKQFKKILHILCKDYFQKLKHVSTSGGPVGRLRDFLHSTITKRHVATPDGILDSYFWRT